MGDRICIRFIDEHSKSAVLYAHWRGERLLDDVKEFMQALNNTDQDSVYPLGRREPESMMFNFIWWITRDNGGFTRSSYFLYPEFNCDTGDNGPHEINSITGEVTKIEQEAVE